MKHEIARYKDEKMEKVDLEYDETD